MELLGRIARKLIRRLVRIYYPTIEVSGREHIPREGGVLLAANHSNSLIDPVIVGIAADRKVHFLAKAPLFNIPLLGRAMQAVGMIPAFRAQDDAGKVSRNLDSLAAAADYLVQGEAVGIFPEGKSHDELRVEQVKSGAGRIAVAAVQRWKDELRESQTSSDGNSCSSSLQVIPIAINFERKERFRSAVWVQIGEPFDAAEVLAKEGGDERRAMRAITTELDRRLKRVVIHLDDPKWAPFIEDLEVLLPRPRTRNRVAALRQRKRIADAMNHFLATDHAGAEAMAAKVSTYRDHLVARGLTPQSPIMRLRRLALTMRMTWDFVWLFLWSPVAFIGFFFHIIPFLIVRAIVPKMQAPGKSTIALTRLGLSLPTYLLWYAGAWFAIRSYFLPWVAWTWVSLMPLAGLLAVSYCRRARELYGGWWAQTKLFWQTTKLRTLREEQANVRAALERLAADYAQVNPSNDPEPTRVSWRRLAWMTVRWALIAGAAYGIFVWQHAYTHRRDEERYAGLNLSTLSAHSLSASLDADEVVVRDVLHGLNELDVRIQSMMAGFASGKRSWYSQADNDAVRQLMLSYMNYRTALLRVVWRYQQFDEAREERSRLRALLANYTAASAIYVASLKFVAYFENAPDAVRKLNEPEPVWGIPANLYESVRRSLADPENRRMLARSAARYREAAGAFRQFDLASTAPYAEFHQAIARADETTTRLNAPLLKAMTERTVVETRDATKGAAYKVSSFVSTWIGDTKVRQPRNGKALITPELLKELRPKLQPGDVMLERRNWFLSNAFLPGYWPHATLFVGTSNDIVQLGLDKDPRVQRRWKDFLRSDEKGHEHVIIESVSEGVVFSSVEHSVGEADALAVLRPRLTLAQKREAIARAFSHVGKPYDFDFDFFSTDKLVCTELVFRAYDGEIQFPLVKIMGTTTMPAIELVRKFAIERGAANAQFDFVAFIDADEIKNRAWFRDEAAFVATTNRPGVTLLQPAQRSSSGR